MKTPQEHPDRQDAEALAALYLSGAMTPEERQAFERALEHERSSERQALLDLDRAAGALLESVPPLAPNDSVRERLLARVREDAVSPTGFRRDGRNDHVWNAWAGSATGHVLFTLKSTEGAWEDTSTPGVRVRQLFVDHEANRMTAMFRMDPGASYVPHVHDGYEECYVLEGDLHVGDAMVMRAGDYQRASAGSVHQRQWTKGGCLLLVSSSLTDEHLEESDSHAV